MYKINEKRKKKKTPDRLQESWPVRLLFFFFKERENLRFNTGVRCLDPKYNNTHTHTHTSTCDAEYIVFDSDHREEETCEEFYFQNAIQYINSVQYYDFYRQDFTYHNYYKYYYYYYYYKCYSLELQRLIDQSIGKKKKSPGNHLIKLLQKCHTVSVSSLSNMTMCCYSLSYMTVNEDFRMLIRKISILKTLLWLLINYKCHFVTFLFNI